jgi:hypothetical protein
VPELFSGKQKRRQFPALGALLNHMALWRVHLGLGVWTLVSPWVLGFSDISIMRWSNVVVGVALIITSAWALFGQEQGERSKNYEL